MSSVGASPIPVSRADSRRRDLDLAKGLGILLVVVGHLAAKSQPSGNVWFTLLQTALYQFHMPFFMYLSGYVCFLSGAALTRPASWTKLLHRRTTRLLVPFVVFGLALILGKLLAARFMHVDNAPSSAMDGLIGMIWNTDHSPAISVWYIVVVFALTISTPPLLWATGGRIWPILVLAAVLYASPMAHVLYLDRIARFFLFFALGGLAARGADRWLEFIDKTCYLWLLALFAALAAVLVEFDSLSDAFRLLVCGVISMPALHGLVRRSRLSDSKILFSLGLSSFVIYLLNTPFIGLSKGLLLKAMPWDGPNFLIFFAALLTAGLLGPILTKHYIFRRIPWLDKITD